MLGYLMQWGQTALRAVLPGGDETGSDLVRLVAGRREGKRLPEP